MRYGRRIRLTVVRLDQSEFFVGGGVGSTMLRAFQAAQAGEAKTRDEAGAVVITDMRVQCQIEKSLGKTPNKAEVTITNLAPITRGAFTRTPLVVHIEAGYVDDMRHIYTGDMRTGGSELRETDWETKLTLGEGSRALAHARINRSYRRGTSVVAALRDAAASMGLDLPPDLSTSSELQRQFSSGIALQGNAADEMSKLLAPYGYSMSVQNGRLQILRDEDVSDDGTLNLIAGPPEQGGTGMIGSPALDSPTARKKKKAPTMTVRHMLLQQATPGGRVRVKSRDVDGMFKLEKVVHKLDTHGNAWESELKLRAL